MALVSWPCRKSLASAPVSASLPRSDLSTTNVTDETLALVQAREPALDLALELVHHAVARDAGGERAAHDRGLLDAVKALEEREEAVEVEWEGVIGHVYSRCRSCRSPTNSRKSSTRCRRTGRTSSSTCASRRTATSTPPRCSSPATRSRTRITTGTSTSSSRTASGTRRRRRSSTAR